VGSFTGPLLLEYLDGRAAGRSYRLIAGFSYETEIGGLGVIHVPAGFITDFASVPRFFWRLFPPTGTYGKAAVVHDYLYRCTDIDRAICDAVFLEAMEVLGVSWIARRLMHRAVRVFGKFARKRMC